MKKNVFDVLEMDYLLFFPNRRANLIATATLSVIHVSGPCGKVRSVSSGLNNLRLHEDFV